MQWDLESIYRGGSSSAEVSEGIRKHETMLDAPPKGLEDRIRQELTLDEELAQLESFISCLMAQNQEDVGAKGLMAKLNSVKAKMASLSLQIDQELKGMSDEFFAQFLQKEPMREIAYSLIERRRQIVQKLPIEQEILAEHLSVDGYHGWGQFYPALVESIKIPIKGKELSFGQLENLFSSPDRAMRKQAFEAWENELQNRRGLFAHVLNSIAGFRLELYKSRGWNDPLQDPLAYNRMKKETLEALFSAIQGIKPHLHRFMQRQAELLHLDKLAWYDLDAPLDGAQSELIPYKKGFEMIIEQFQNLHPKMAELARRAQLGHWVEAEDRKGKRPGGFCTHLPKSRQSRIFMTYRGTPNNLSTLAHELGHAYHNHACEGLPIAAQHYRMNVAETASTFAEVVVADSLIEQATPGQKQALLGDLLQGAVAYCMNLPARFLFETRFYDQRKNSHLTPDQLDHLMVEAQKDAYGNVLSTWHPKFWAGKMHFYFTDVPFYNFPYTFGYLFSQGIYERFRQEGPSFAPRYDALLRDSGQMDVEDLAQKHLGVDLMKREFWDSALEKTKRDVEMFLKF